jgi:hypothetical protein
MFGGVIEAINLMAMGVAEATVQVLITASDAAGAGIENAVVWLEDFGIMLLASLTEFNAIMLDWLESLLLAA